GHDGEPLEATPSSESQGGETVEELRRQVEEKQDRLLRALAEAENIRRRSQRDREEYVRYANESLLRGFLPGLDQRERLKVRERAGVPRYSALGQPFDPTRHEAIARVVSADAKPGTVVAETAPGYQLHTRVLRAALVAVAAAPDEDA